MFLIINVLKDVRLSLLVPCPQVGDRAGSATFYQMLNVHLTSYPRCWFVSPAYKCCNPVTF